jgi:hypothetical protein
MSGEVTRDEKQRIRGEKPKSKSLPEIICVHTSGAAVTKFLRNHRNKYEVL